MAPDVQNESGVRKYLLKMLTTIVRTFTYFIQYYSYYYRMVGNECGCVNCTRSLAHTYTQNIVPLTHCMCYVVCSLQREKRLKTLLVLKTDRDRLSPSLSHVFIFVWRFFVCNAKYFSSAFFFLSRSRNIVLKSQQDIAHLQILMLDELYTTYNAQKKEEEIIGLAFLFHRVTNFNFLFDISILYTTVDCCRHCQSRVCVWSTLFISFIFCIW